MWDPEAQHYRTVDSNCYVEHNCKHSWEEVNSLTINFVTYLKNVVDKVSDVGKPEHLDL